MYAETFRPVAKDCDISSLATRTVAKRSLSQEFPKSPLESMVATEILGPFSGWRLRLVAKKCDIGRQPMTQFLSVSAYMPKSLCRKVEIFLRFSNRPNFFLRKSYKKSLKLGIGILICSGKLVSEGHRSTLVRPVDNPIRRARIGRARDLVSKIGRAIPLGPTDSGGPRIL